MERFRIPAILTVAALLATAVVGLSLAGTQAALPAAGSGTPASAECPVLTADELAARVTAFVEATNAEDLSRLEGLLHDDHTHHWAIGWGVLDRAAYLVTVGELWDAYENYSFTADQIIVAEDDGVVVLRWTASGTQAREFGGFLPSDRQVTWTGIMIFRFECGQIVELWTEADHLSRLQQQGAVPGPAATPAP